MVNCCVCWKESNPLVFRQFHRFPANAERRQKWFNTIGRNITAYKNATICSDHFTEEDYYYCGTSARRRLQKTAIPSVLLQRSHNNFEQPSTSCSIENVNSQESIMDIQHKSTVNNEQSTRDIQQDIICAEPTLGKENVNPQESIMDIQQNIICTEPTLGKENINPQESVMDIQQDIICAEPALGIENVNLQESIMDIQQDIICAEPTLSKENVTNRKRKHFCEKKRVFIQTDKDTKALIRKTDFINVEAWNKFVKFLNYSRYIHKRFVKQLHLKKKNVTVKSAEEMLKTKNFIQKNILDAL